VPVSAGNSSRERQAKRKADAATRLPLVEQP
jgi:hypothetical protein